MNKQKLNLLEHWLNDESFANWAKQENSEDIKKWEEYFSEYPKHWDTAKKAKLIITGIEYQKILKNI